MKIESSYLLSAVGVYFYSRTSGLLAIRLKQHSSIATDGRQNLTIVQIPVVATIFISQHVTNLCKMPTPSSHPSPKLTDLAKCISTCTCHLQG